MAAGYDLKEGIYVDRSLSDDEMWSSFAYLFSSKSHNDTSYKFGFLKAILDNLYNVDNNLKLTFDQLFSKFAESYWNLVLKHHIRQKKPGNLNRMSALERVLYDTQERYHIVDSIPFESLTMEMMLYVCKNVKQKSYLQIRENMRKRSWQNSTICGILSVPKIMMILSLITKPIMKSSKNSERSHPVRPFLP
ncbi:MAG: hypothetical protein Q4E53_05695 [Eubacteriales bacterium]|nr:hypothetical protein [Eubacteriales bacterium]